MGLFSFFTKGGNYGLIARNVTAFHESLRARYQTRFPDYKTLLVFAGLMDVAAYTSKGQISPGEIVAIADESLEGLTSWPADAKSSAKVLRHFIIWIEILIFTADNPSHINISEGVLSRSDEISENIIQILDQYSTGRTTMLADHAAKQWMTSPQMAPLREALGIREE